MRKLILSLFLVALTASLFSCGASSKGAQADEASVKAEAEAKYAELVKRQNQLLQEMGEIK